MTESNSQMKQSLGQYIKEWCETYPSFTVIMTLEKKELVRTSFEQLYADVMAWVAYLREHGIKPGDRVAMIAPKCPNHFRFFYACWTIGAIAVPICETLGDLEMGFVLRDCDAGIVIVDKSLAKKVTANAGNIPVVVMDELPLNVPLDTPKVEPYAAEPDSVAVLIYTSGSTGQPKGVMLTQKNIWTNAFWAINSFTISGKDSIMSLLPYWHSYALVCEILCAPMCGASCSIPKDIRDFKKNLPIYQPTIMIAVPRIVEAIKAGIDKQISELPPKQKALVEKAKYNASRIFTAGPRLDGGILRMLTHHTFYDPLVFRKFRQGFGGKLRFIVCGGAPMDLELQIFFKYIGVMALVGYGLTETSPVISANLPEAHRLSSCGKVMPWLLPENGGDFTFKDDEGNMGKDVSGQLLVKGNCVMKGYWRHTDASAKSFEDGWLNTGDMGHCDKDGYLYIQGRKGNMIVLIGGEKLHPEHIEDAVKNSPYISEAMVIGEKCKSVYVCVNVAADQVKGMTKEEIESKIKEEVHVNTNHLAAYQKPRGVLILPDFNQENGTMTATLKIRRFKIKELYRSEIEQFLISNGEDIATKRELGIASSKVLESLESGTAVVGNGVVLN